MTQPLTVLSFNIRYDNPADGENGWPHRQAAVAKIVSTADIAALQEVVHGQLTDLQQELPAFTAIGVGRTDGKQTGEYAPILYRTERFKLLRSGTFWLSPEPEKAGSKGWDASLPRICTWAQFEEKQSRRRFFCFNTHFDHRGEKARLESARLIMQRILAIAGDAPVLLTGDFNAVAESEPIQAILKPATPPGGALRDSRTASTTEPRGPGSTWNGFNKVDPNTRIDFIFVGGPLKVSGYEEITTQLPEGRWPSDHLPVKALVELE